MGELPTAKNYSGVHTVHAVCRDPGLRSLAGTRPGGDRRKPGTGYPTKPSQRTRSRGSAARRWISASTSSA